MFLRNLMWTYFTTRPFLQSVFIHRNSKPLAVTSLQHTHKRQVCGVCACLSSASNRFLQYLSISFLLSLQGIRVIFLMGLHLVKFIIYMNLFSSTHAFSLTLYAVMTCLQFAMHLMNTSSTRLPLKKLLKSETNERKLCHSKANSAKL